MAEQHGGPGNMDATGAVIDEKLLRDCIYIDGHVRPGLSEDAAHGKGSSGPAYAAGAPRGKHAVGGRGPAGGAGAFGATNQSSAPLRVMELHEVTSLMLSYRRISCIDNLVGVDRVVKLHLDNNNISKIENLHHLRQLRSLDLSFNKITAIAGLEQLTELEDLSLYSNRIAAVENLDTNTKLMCLSLGRNQIDNLDDTARYLHKFRHLRMLTLQGNKIDQQAHYRQRLLSHIGRLRFLDSRAVFDAEVAKAKEDQKENLLGIEDADRKEQEQENATAHAATEAAEYANANCPDDKKFHAEIMAFQPEGRNVNELLEADAVRERVKEHLDSFQEKFTNQAKELSDRMKAIREKKKADAEDYNKTLRRAKAGWDEAGKDAIRAFEKKLKKVIKPGLKEQPRPETYDEAAVRTLKDDLEELRSVLLEMEADQQDAYESLNKAFEDAMEKHKADAVETLGQNFEELRVIEKGFYEDLKRKFDAWNDERQKAEQEQKAGEPSFGDHPRDNQAMQLMENRDEFNKVMQEWHDLHAQKIDKKEEFHKANEDHTFKAIAKANAQAEHERNRWRAGEISAYVKRQRDKLEQWQALADVFQ